MLSRLRVCEPVFSSDFSTNIKDVFTQSFYRKIWFNFTIVLLSLFSDDRLYPSIFRNDNHDGRRKQKILWCERVKSKVGVQVRKSEKKRPKKRRRGRVLQPDLTQRQKLREEIDVVEGLLEIDSDTNFIIDILLSQICQGLNIEIQVGERILVSSI